MEPDRAHARKQRQHEIFSQIIRHLTALVYLIAELVIGERPDSLKN